MLLGVLPDSNTFVLLLTTATSLYIYKNAGVVGDVPELEVVKGHTHRGMWAEYCDRGFKYDKEFSDDTRTKCYVIGNSFGRDVVNIILESNLASEIDVVYSDLNGYKEKNERFKKADIVLFSALPLSSRTIDDVKTRCTKDCDFFIIGEKNFGENNGQIYRHRYETNFHDMTVEMEEGYAERNKRLKRLYPSNYIDMIELVQLQDGKVRVFTDDGRFISQDCRHLTRAGAQYYAKLMNWKEILKEQN